MTATQLIAITGVIAMLMVGLPAIVSHVAIPPDGRWIVALGEALRR